MRAFSPYEEMPLIVVLLLMQTGGLGWLCRFLSLSVPTSIIVAFAVSLLACHAWFALFRGRHGADVPKYIDYVYLFVGALGLLASSIEYTNSRFDRTQRDAVTHVVSALTAAREVYGATYLYNCTDDKNASIRVILIPFDKAKCRYLKEWLDTYDVDGPLDGDASYFMLGQRIMAVRELNRLVPDAGYYTQFNKQFETYMPLTVRTGMDFVWLPPAVMDAMRFIGFMLLSTAIALRITKVTVEVRGWYRKPGTRQEAKVDIPSS
jgi:hypothetical protein